MTSFDVKKALLLYAVTDRAWLGERTLAAVCEDVLKNGATFLQLREKELHGEALLAEARELKALAGRYGVPFVVDDDVEAALACNATCAILSHNHISGLALPSQADLVTTRRLWDVLRNVGVELVDHLIFADDDMVSLKDSGIFEGFYREER